MMVIPIISSKATISIPESRPLTIILKVLPGPLFTVQPRNNDSVLRCRSPRPTSTVSIWSRLFTRPSFRNRRPQCLGTASGWRLFSRESSRFPYRTTSRAISSFPFFRSKDAPRFSLLPGSAGISCCLCFIRRIRASRGILTAQLV